MFAEFGKELGNIMESRVHMASLIANTMTAPMNPSPELMAVRMAMIPSVMDTLTKINPKDPIYDMLNEAITKTAAELQKYVGFDVMEQVTIMRTEAAAHVERMREGDDILGGIEGLFDGSDN